MGEPAQFFACALCKEMTDATTATPAWFVNDTTITPVRGYICGACAIRLPSCIDYDGEVFDRRSVDEEDSDGV